MGYDRERFVGEVNEGLLCSICRDVLEDPVVTPCEHAFCSSCIWQWLQHQPFCPEDRTHLDATQLRAPARYMKNDWAQLRIRCCNQSHGCEFICALESIRLHEAQCDRDPAPSSAEPLRHRGGPEKRPSVVLAVVDALKAERTRLKEQISIEMSLQIQLDGQTRRSSQRESVLRSQRDEIKRHISFLKCLPGSAGASSGFR